MLYSPNFKEERHEGATVFEVFKESFTVFKEKMTFSETNVPLWIESADFINLLDSLYNISEYKETLSFLSQNQSLVPLLVDSYMEIIKIFPKESVLNLQIEANEFDEQKLVILIDSGLDLEIAYSLLDSLDASWWFDNASMANGKLNIDLEY